MSHRPVTGAVDRLLAELAPVGQDSTTGGYHRFAWTAADAQLREWFAGEAAARGLDLTVDRAGNQWAWAGDPDERPGVVLGSHLDSVPDGGAYDGPLGVVSAFAALDALRAQAVVPGRPLAVVNFVDEEGARFGVACAGSRLITGALDPERARGLVDGDGVTMAEAMRRAGHDAAAVGPDPATLRRIAVFVELHVEQGRALAERNSAVGVGSAIWPHGRWRVELRGEANHAGTTRLADRNDPMLAFADLVTAARAAALRHDALATCGKVRVEPNGVNAIPSRVTAWVDARGADEARVRAMITDLDDRAGGGGARLIEESWTGETAFDPALTERICTQLGGAPLLATGAGHDAGILAAAGIPTAMLFVRNPTGVSHSPAEHAEPVDCAAGVDALTAVARELVR